MDQEDLTPEDRAILMMVRIDLVISAFKRGQYIDRRLLRSELTKAFEAAEKRGARLVSK